MKRVKSERSAYADLTDRKFRKSTGDLAPGYADLVVGFLISDRIARNLTELKWQEAEDFLLGGYRP